MSIWKDTGNNCNLMKLIKKIIATYISPSTVYKTLVSTLISNVTNTTQRTELKEILATYKLKDIQEKYLYLHSKT